MEPSWCVFFPPYSRIGVLELNWDLCRGQLSLTLFCSRCSEQVLCVRAPGIDLLAFPPLHILAPWRHRNSREGRQRMTWLCSQAELAVKCCLQLGSAPWDSPDGRSTLCGEVTGSSASNYPWNNYQTFTSLFFSQCLYLKSWFLSATEKSLQNCTRWVDVLVCSHVSKLMLGEVWTLWIKWGFLI